MALETSIWGDLPYNFVLQARAGLRFDMVLRTNGYIEVPLDLGLFYSLGGRSFRVLLGGGIGAHHFWETRGERVEVGSVIYARSDIEARDRGWGFAAFGRFGVMVRNHRGRGGFMLSAELSNTFRKYNGHGNQTAVIIATSAIY
jgi:hypothetical protein